MNGEVFYLAVGNAMFWLCSRTGVSAVTSSAPSQAVHTRECKIKLPLQGRCEESTCVAIRNVKR